MSPSQGDHWTQLRVTVCSLPAASQVVVGATQIVDTELVFVPGLGATTAVASMECREPLSEGSWDELGRQLVEKSLEDEEGATRLAYLVIFVGLAPDAVTAAADSSAMASLPVLLQGVHASVAADQLEAEGLAASLMSAIIAAAAEVATNPEFSITREALTDVAVQASRVEVSDELTVAEASSESAEFSETTENEKAVTPARAGSGWSKIIRSLHRMRELAGTTWRQRGVGTARAASPMSDLEAAAAGGRALDILYVVQASSPDLDRSLRTREQYLTSLLGARLDDPSHGDWYACVLHADRALRRVAGPVPVGRLATAAAGATRGYDFSVRDASRQLAALIAEDRAALHRRGMRVIRTHILFLTIGSPLVDSAAAAAYRDLVSGADQVVWVSFGELEAPLSEDLRTGGTRICRDHDDIAEQVFRELISARTGI